MLSRCELTQQRRGLRGPLAHRFWKEIVVTNTTREEKRREVGFKLRSLCSYRGEARRTDIYPVSYIIGTKNPGGE